MIVKKLFPPFSHNFSQYKRANVITSILSARNMFYRIIFILLFFIYYLNAFYIKIPSVKMNKRIDLMTNLIGNCSPDVKASILITDSSNNSVYNNFYKSITESMIQLDNSENFGIPLNQKTPIFWVTMILTSPMKVKEVLVNETWRNFNQSFIILDGGNVSNGCDNAQSFLMEAWKNDILNVIFICWDRQTQIPKLYSFNPFTDFAPSSWNKVSMVTAFNNHSWTLISQIYNPDKATYRELFFDRTNNLGGYIIKSSFVNGPPYISYKIINGSKIFEGYDYEVIKLLTKQLNASLIINDEIPKFFGNFDSDTDKSLSSEIVTKKIDLPAVSFFLRQTVKRVEMTYPSLQPGLSVMTQYRESKLLAGQFFSFLSPYLALLLFATNIFIFIILHYVFKDPYSKSLMDIVRVYLNVPLPSLTVTNPGKIIFGTTVVTFTVYNIVVQSYINTALVSRNAIKNVHSIEDLNESKYNVYALAYAGIAMKLAGVKNVISTMEILNCSQLGKYDAFVETEIALRTIKTEKCYMPRKPLISGIYVVYASRRNWPIFPKINKNLQMISEGGLIMNQISKILMKYRQRKRDKSDQYQVITMDHVKYLFYIYIVLNFISLVVLFIELLVARLLRAIDRVHNPTN